MVAKRGREQTACARARFKAGSRLQYIGGSSTTDTISAILLWRKGEMRRKGFCLYKNTAKLHGVSGRNSSGFNIPGIEMLNSRGGNMDRGEYTEQVTFTSHSYTLLKCDKFAMPRSQGEIALLRQVCGQKSASLFKPSNYPSTPNFRAASVPIINDNVNNNGK